MTTPMFQQYHALKASHPNAILFFRMGDFYEVFYDDAKIASKVLDIALTSRNRNDPNPIPMAGVPHHAATSYVQRLTEEGFRVAIAEQVQLPSEAKGLVKRKVVKVVTPGIALDPGYLDANSGNYLVSICVQETTWGIAFLDASTGHLKTTQVGSVEDVLTEIARLEPRESILSPEAQKVPTLTKSLQASQILQSELEEEAWETNEATRELCDAYRVTDLSSLDLTDLQAATSAAGAVIRYARTLTGGSFSNLQPIQTYRNGKHLVLDETTRRNLEVSRTMLGGKRKGSLVWLLDQTSTAMGSRMLREWLAFPLLDIREIKTRQDAIAVLREHFSEGEKFAETLKEVADIERIIGRVTQGTGNARDLAGLRRSLNAAPRALKFLTTLPGLQDWLPEDPCTDLRDTLNAWLVDDPPISITEGGMFRQGVSAELDEFITLSVEGVNHITQLESNERDLSGITTLKIRRNRMFGYYIEVTRANLHKVPEDRYLRKQTLTNAERYITAELKELEDKVLGADERRKTLEHALFVQLRDDVRLEVERLSALARKLAALDALCNFAGLANEWDWVRPTVNNETTTDIVAGRHPVVEALLKESRFIPNDSCIGAPDRRFVVLTGPNMSGKSTIMRQVAVITLLAQIGSCVPASSAKIGVCDRIFTRVGASDNLSEGQSTFMVEMAETAVILQNATNRSLVVLDEIGRGTSTYDGLAIAWAVAEEIADNIGCRGFFATHYHELCELASGRSGVVNQSVSVIEKDGDIIFLRTLQDGGANRSYGIQCAKLAGLPKHVVKRAGDMLRQFEQAGPRNERNQLSLFGHTPSSSEPTEPPPVPPSDPLREALETLDPDDMTPRKALDALYQLRKLR